MERERVWFPAKLPDGSDGMRCTRHDVVFSRLEVCEACHRDPPPKVRAPDIGDPPTTPANVRSALDHEAALVTLAEEIEETARSLCRGKVRVRANLACAAKLYSEAIRARRAAMELAMRREDEELVNRREKRLRDMHYGARLH